MKSRISATSTISEFFSGPTQWLRSKASHFNRSSRISQQSVDVSTRGGSGESKEQQLLRPNRKIHKHSFIHSTQWLRSNTLTTR
jgi:hypothetical protein